MTNKKELLEVLLNIWNNPIGPIPWDWIESILKDENLVGNDDE